MRSVFFSGFRWCVYNIKQRLDFQIFQYFKNYAYATRHYVDRTERTPPQHRDDVTTRKGVLPTFATHTRARARDTPPASPYGYGLCPHSGVHATELAEPVKHRYCNYYCAWSPIESRPNPIVSLHILCAISIRNAARSSSFRLEKNTKRKSLTSNYKRVYRFHTEENRTKT